MSTPPYTSLLEWLDGNILNIHLNLENYNFWFKDSIYAEAYLGSLKTAAFTSLACLLIGYPMAYGIARSQPKTQIFLMMLVILPFWTSFLIRIFAWIGLLNPRGFINSLLLKFHLIDHPIMFLQNGWGIYIGMVYCYLPFMIFPLYTSLEKIDLTLLEAAYDLGAKPWRAFLKVTLPLSLSGLISGCFLVFIPAVGEFVIPELLGDSSDLMIGKVLWSEFFNNHNWPIASAVAFITVLFLLIPIVAFQNLQKRMATS